jgi:DNA polymerase-3 subunit delta
LHEYFVERGFHVRVVVRSLKSQKLLDEELIRAQNVSLLLHEHVALSGIIVSMVWVIVGDNDYEVRESVSQIVTEHATSYGKDSIERFDGEEIESADMVLDAVRSVSFLTPKKLVLVRSFAQSRDLLENIEAIVDQCADTTTLILTDRKIDKRSNAYKYLSKNTSYKNYEVPDERSLVSWVVEIVAEKEGAIDRAAAQEIVRRVGPNQQLIMQEITKLLTYNPTITQEAVELLIEPMPQSIIFDLLQSAFHGNLSQTYELYRQQRTQGEEPQKIISMLTWQLQQLISVFYAGSDQEALKTLKVNPYAARKLSVLLRGVDAQRLRDYVNDLITIDQQTKKNADPESALMVYFAKLATS